MPDEGGSIKVYNSTQFADAAQEAVAHALGLRLHEVDVICRRVGGGFGGKLNRWVLVVPLCPSAGWWCWVGGCIGCCCATGCPYRPGSSKEAVVGLGGKPGGELGCARDTIEPCRRGDAWTPNVGSSTVVR